MFRPRVARPRLTFAALLAWCTWTLAACSSWDTVDPASEFSSSARPPREVRVVRAVDHAPLRLSQPVLHGDTLIGTAQTRQTVADTAGQVGITLSELEDIQEQHFSLLRTIVLLAGLTGGVVAMGLVTRSLTDIDYAC